MPGRLTLLGSSHSAWSLLAVPNLELLIDSDQISGSDGDLLSTVPDYSGNARNGSAAGSVRPALKIISGERRIRFDATDDIVSFGNFMAGATGLSIFAVWSRTQASNVSMAVSKHSSFGSGGEWAFRVTNSPNVRERTQLATDVIISGTDKTSLVAASSVVLSSVTWQGNQEPTYYTNGVALAAVSGTGWASAANVGTTSNPIRLGYVPGFLNPAGGDVLDLAIVSRKVNSTELANIHNTLLRKRFPWQVVCDGDSLTAGTDSGVDTTNFSPWPSQLGPLLNSRAAIYNFGVVGQGLSSMASDASTQIDAILGAFYQKKVCVVWGGTNDLAGGTDGNTAYGLLVSYCNARRAAGWKVVVVTALPRSDASISAGFETERGVFNTAIRNNYATFADALADVAADSRIGDAGDEADTTYYLGSPSPNVHLNNAGAAIVAASVAAAINGLA